MSMVVQSKNYITSARSLSSDWNMISQSWRVTAQSCRLNGFHAWFFVQNIQNNFVIWVKILPCSRKGRGVFVLSVRCKVDQEKCIVTKFLHWWQSETSDWPRRVKSCGRNELPIFRKGVRLFGNYLLEQYLSSTPNQAQRTWIEKVTRVSDRIQFEFKTSFHSMVEVRFFVSLSGVTDASVCQNRSKELFPKTCRRKKTRYPRKGSCNWLQIRSQFLKVWSFWILFSHVFCHHFIYVFYIDFQSFWENF